MNRIFDSFPEPELEPTSDEGLQGLYESTQFLNGLDEGAGSAAAYIGDEDLPNRSEQLPRNVVRLEVDPLNYYNNEMVDAIKKGLVGLGVSEDEHEFLVFAGLNTGSGKNPATITGTHAVPIKGIGLPGEEYQDSLSYLYDAATEEGGGRPVLAVYDTREMQIAGDGVVDFEPKEDHENLEEALRGVFVFSDVSDSASF